MVGAYLKRYLYILFIGLILFSLLPPNKISQVKAVEFSYNDFWFFVDTPTNISYPEMNFIVKNNEPDPLLINCTYETIEGINISVKFDWDNMILQPQEEMRNNYSIQVYSFFNVTYTARIYLHTSVIDEQNNTQKALTGGIIANKITFYSENVGAYLDLRIVDQSDKPRVSDIVIRYKQNETGTLTPIKQLKDSWYQGYLPKGHYQIFARDSETGLTGEENFFLGSDTQIDLELELVGFGQFMYVSSKDNRTGETRIAINCTVNNFVETLHEVRIFCKLYFNGEELTITEEKYEEELPKTAGKRYVMWFPPVDWKIGKYEIRGFIYSYEIPIASDYLSFTIDILEDIQRNPENYFPYLIASGSIILSIIIYIRSKKVKGVKNEPIQEKDNS